jgi:DNA polymerase III subunit delta'
VARAPKLEEERPPYDALEGVPLPRETNVLVGHQAAEQALLDAYRSGRMHHAWIVSGERGIGKATLAFRFARFIFAHPDPAAPDVAAAPDLFVPPDHPSARRLAIGAHGNLLHLQRDWIERDKRYRSELSVDSIRRITPFLGTTAGEGGWRIVIVDTADDMNRSAANAILKNLEEPPKKTLFLLLAERRGALLPTILSRSRTLALDPLTAAETENVVRTVAPEIAGGEDTSLAAALAGGSPRRFIELTRRNGVELYRLMRRAIEAGDRPAQFKLSTLASDAAGTEQLLDLFETYLSRRLRGLPEPGDGGSPRPVPLVTLAELWEKAALSGREVETYNLDRRQFVLDLLETAAAAFRQAGMAKTGTPNRS